MSNEELIAVVGTNESRFDFVSKSELPSGIGLKPVNKSVKKRMDNKVYPLFTGLDSPDGAFLQKLLEKNYEGGRAIQEHEFNYLFLDFETTGLSCVKDYPIECAFIASDGGDEETLFSETVNLPDNVEVPDFVTDLTGLTTETINIEGVDNQQVKSVLQEFINEYTIVVAHNANFDLGFLHHHFGIDPRRFICTRAVEALTHPQKSLSMKDVYPRYYDAKEQSHRALDDVKMLKDVFFAQQNVHGSHAMEFFMNKTVITTDRKPVYTPAYQTILDLRNM